MGKGSHETTDKHMDYHLYCNLKFVNKSETHFLKGIKWMYTVTTKIRLKINMSKLLICSICDSYPFLNLNLF